MPKTSLDRFLDEVITSEGFWRVRTGLFVRESVGNLGLLGITRKKYSGGGWAALTPHLAVISRRLANIANIPVVVEEPDLFNHSWYRWAFNIHHEVLMEGGDNIDDWGAQSETDPTTWIKAEADLTTRVLPALREHLSDEGLRDCWTEHRDPFKSELTQATHLAVLARDLGPVDVYASARSSIEGLLASSGTGAAGFRVARPLLRDLGIAIPGD